MKNIFIVLVLVICTFAMIACKPSTEKSIPEIVIKKSDIIKRNIGVNGMTCVGCEVTLEEEISKIKGVVGVKASHTKKDVSIEFDSTKTTFSAISKIIRKSGYKPYHKK